MIAVKKHIDIFGIFIYNIKLRNKIQIIRRKL